MLARGLWLLTIRFGVGTAPYGPTASGFLSGSYMLVDRLIFSSRERSARERLRGVREGLTEAEADGEDVAGSRVMPGALRKAFPLPLETVRCLKGDAFLSAGSGIATVLARSLAAAATVDGASERPSASAGMEAVEDEADSGVEADWSW